tara:strand:+ start:1146 stop:2018 length:873 start_codon:yes stop_codon:yes gene_type:complete
MRDFTDEFIELIRMAATDLPDDVEEALGDARGKEKEGTAAHGALDTILSNVAIARRESLPICQDTGTPIFYVKYPEGLSTLKLREQIKNAVVEGTKRNYLRPNAVDALTDKNSGNNLGDDAFPTIHFDEVEGTTMTIDLMLKGGGCENVGAQYSLPNNGIGAGRDMKGVRKAVLDAVQKAQGQGCAPGILGVAIGGDRGSSYHAAKEQLLRKLHDTNPDPELNAMEQQLKDESNELGIGPMGFGGETSILDVKMTGMHRLPASYFVSVSYMCWASRVRRMTVDNDNVTFK